MDMMEMVDVSGEMMVEEGSPKSDLGLQSKRYEK